MCSILYWYDIVAEIWLICQLTVQQTLNFVSPLKNKYEFIQMPLYFYRILHKQQVKSGDMELSVIYHEIMLHSQ